MIPKKICTVFLAITCLALSGCALFSPKGLIKLGGDRVQAVENAGTPAQLSKASAGTQIALAAGSKVVVTEKKAVPAQAATATTPAVAAQAAVTETVIIPSAGTQWVKNEESASAGTGTVDTSVQIHQIDVENRRWLLWAAIGCGIAGIVLKSMLPAWPGLSNGLLIASPAAFAAWKFAEVPGWLWFAVIAVVGLLAAGYKRAEWDKNGDGIPDFLQKKTSPPTPSA